MIFQLNLFRSDPYIVVMDILSRSLVQIFFVAVQCLWGYLKWVVLWLFVFSINGFMENRHKHWCESFLVIAKPLSETSNHDAQLICARTVCIYAWLRSSRVYQSMELSLPCNMTSAYWAKRQQELYPVSSLFQPFNFVYMYTCQTCQYAPMHVFVSSAWSLTVIQFQGWIYHLG